MALHQHIEMKIGLVGFAGSGKTTVFNTMTGLDAPVGYGGEVRLGIVRVPAERIDELSQIFSPKKTTFAEMSFCDVPGEHGADKKDSSPAPGQTDREQLLRRWFANAMAALHLTVNAPSRSGACGRSSETSECWCGRTAISELTVPMDSGGLPSKPC